MNIMHSVSCIKHQYAVRAHLEYGVSVWNPHLQKDIERIQNVQRWATKPIHGMEDIFMSQ